MPLAPHITLGELQRRVKESLIERFPKAQARAVIWRSSYGALSTYFEQETGQRLAAGIRILASVVVNYHELYGFSLQIIAIDPAFTLGDMEQQRQQTIARLQEEGVWELNHTQPMPPLVQRLAIISSPQAAGYRDFMQELSQSPYAFHTTLFHAVMQGSGAEDSIVAALDAIAEHQEAFDAVVIVRGGGSTSDLNCFNGYRLCAHIAQFPRPILTGIGHDKDQSVADMVAHTALKTPTAVATWLVERMATLDGWLEGAALQLHDLLQRTMRSEELRLERLRQTLRQEARNRLTHHRLRLNQAGVLLPECVRDALRYVHKRLDIAQEAVESRSPQRILQLGFAIVRADGHALRSKEELCRHKLLSIELADGVTEIRNTKPETKN